MTENLVNGQKYRVATNAAKDVWNVLSFETSAIDVKFKDGTTGEDKAAALKETGSKLSNLTTDISEIKKVSSLPGDAASHPTTLYLITD